MVQSRPAVEWIGLFRMNHSEHTEFRNAHLERPEVQSLAIETEESPRNTHWIYSEFQSLPYKTAWFRYCRNISYKIRKTFHKAL